MLRIAHLEEIAGLILELPKLVKLQDEVSPEFIDGAESWLQSVEDALSASRLYQAGSIAAIRSDMIAVRHGQMPAGISFRGRPSRGRILSATASQALQRGNAIASTVIAENQQRITEAERVAYQVIALAASRELIAEHDETFNNTQDLQRLRLNLVSNDDLGAAVAHLEGLVGPHDALIVLDRAATSYFRSVPTRSATTQSVGATIS